MSMDINASRLQAAEPPSVGRANSTTVHAADASDVDAFNAVMEGAPDSDKKGADYAKKNGRSAPSADASKGGDGTDGVDTARANLSGCALLESLFGTRQQMAPAPESVTSSATVPASDSAELVDTLVDRILVSDPGKGPAEVRISLRDGALPGTEVSLTRAADGQLTVKLTSSDTNSFQTLVSAQESLRAALARNGENARVEVDRADNADGGMSGRSGSEQNDARQQSRGYQDYQPEYE